ncbi:MAG: M48 family metalloprotease [Thiobacillus sp.]|nr:M48 family metalloprotease [Thiobacillus sp.]
MASTTERRQQFQDLIRRAEALCAADPAAYRRRIVLLAVLGYGVLFGVLFLLLALIAGGVWAALASTALLILLVKNKLVFVLGYLLYAIARALWVRVEPPEGHALDLRRFPALAEVLADLRRQLATPPIHRVLLSEEFNASISQTPRLGVFGWYRNTLTLGLPLLLAMSPDQAKAVVAHELGHLSGNHGRFASWVYRVRKTWERVMEAFDRSGNWGGRLLARFFDWYAPHFNAYSFALARANEYEADALSARLTSPRDAAAALVTSHVGADRLARDYWQPFLMRADTVARPEGEPYRGLARFLDTPAEVACTGLDRALAVETGYADTHPALADRLRALDAEAPVPAPVSLSAARAWLGEGYEAVLADFDRTWLERNADGWEAHHREIAELRARLAELEAKPADALVPEDLWNRAAWSERLGLDALAHYLAYAATYPDDLDAEFAIGRLLLERNDPAGQAHLERASTRFNLTLAACEAAYGYFLRQGDRETAEIWLRRGEAQLDLQAEARKERAGVTAKDALADAGLTDSERAQLAEGLARMGGVKQAWICRKEVKIDPDSPVYVIAVQPCGWFANGEKLIGRLAQELPCPGLTFFIAKTGRTRKLAKLVMEAGRPIL